MLCRLLYVIILAAAAFSSYANIEGEIFQIPAKAGYEGCSELECYIDENGNLVQQDRDLVVEPLSVVDKEKGFADDVIFVEHLSYGEAPNTLPTAPFGLAIDGKEIATNKNINAARQTDLKLLKDNISMRFDSITKERMLGVEIYRDCNQNRVAMLPYANYPHFIMRSEIWLFDTEEQSNFHPLEIIPVEILGEEIFIDDSFFDQHKKDMFDIILKVYDKKGRFDETARIRLAKDTELRLENIDKLQDYTDKKQIALSGGTLHINGEGLPKGAKVRVMQHTIPIDQKGNFVGDFIIPNGKNVVDVEYTPAPQADTIKYSREVTIKDYDLFYIGVGDFTVGRNSISAPNNIDPATFNDDSGMFDQGRIAFFLRGKVKGEYLLTARADTGASKLKNLFRDLDEHDERSFYRRIDSDKYYPVFSDQAQVDSDYSSQGKLYVKVERDQSYVMWGNYNAEIRSTDLNQIRRTLYGAKAKLVSDQKTKFGDPKSELIVFGAEPNSVPITDEFRGTGGSIYFLSYRDMVISSEKVRIETRDRNSDMVLKTKYLRYGYDYDIDYISGRILLNEPLEGAVDNGGVIKNEGNEWGDPTYLVVSYEARPSLSNIRDANVIGGAAQVWLNDHIKVGVTGAKEDVKGALDNKMYGLDGMLRKTPKTYVKGSYTLTEGTNIERNTSIDGGFTSTTESKFTTNKSKYGIDVEGVADLTDFNEKYDGRVRGYYRQLEAGFSSIARSTQNDSKQYGGAFDFRPYEILGVRFEYDHKDREGLIAQYNRYLGEVTISPKSYLDVTIGGAHNEHTDYTKSTDLGARIKYKFGENHKNDVYVFGQEVIDTKGSYSRNFNRYGLGVNYALLQKIKLGAEGALTDDSNFHAKMRTSYERDSSSTYYVGYDIDSDKSFYKHNNPGSSNMQGAMIIGGRTKYNDGLSMSAEEKYHHGRDNYGHTNNLGVNFSPLPDWAFGTTVEYGDIGPLERFAATGSANYMGEDKNLRTSAEYRREVDTKTLNLKKTRETYVFRISALRNMTDEFSVQGKSNLAYSHGNAMNISRGDFVELSLGVAYRPMEYKKWNILGRYQLYYDFPTTVQSAKSAINTRQKTNVLSVDGNYDMNELVTLGFKYGLRFREERMIEIPSEWLTSTAHLVLLRMDLHITKNWDLFVEGRDLYNVRGDSSQLGTLFGVYRSFGQNVKLGGGFSLSKFDDDLTNMNYNKHGWFINLVSKF